MFCCAVGIERGRNLSELKKIKRIRKLRLKWEHGSKPLLKEMFTKSGQRNTKQMHFNLAVKRMHLRLQGTLPLAQSILKVRTYTRAPMSHLQAVLALHCIGRRWHTLTKEDLTGKNKLGRLRTKEEIIKLRKLKIKEKFKNLPKSKRQKLQAKRKHT